MRIIKAWIAAVVTCVSTGAFAQVATFDVATGILTLPVVKVGTATYTNVLLGLINPANYTFKRSISTSSTIGRGSRSWARAPWSATPATNWAATPPAASRRASESCHSMTRSWPRGGFPAAAVPGLMIAVIHGDADNVNITSAVVNARTGPLDLSVFVFEPQVI